MNNAKPKFEEKLNIFKEYIEEFHELPSGKTVYKDIQLGQWIQNQKAILKAGKLPEERIKMLNDISPFWNASLEEKKIENMRLLLSSDWKSKIPENNTPIDVIYDSNDLYQCLLHNIYDLETLVNLSGYHHIFNVLSRFNIFEIYSKIIPFIDEYYARFIYSAITPRYNRYKKLSFIRLNRAKEVFENLMIKSPEDMKYKIDQMINHSFNEQEKCVINLLYGLEDGIVKNTYETAKCIGIERTARITEIEKRCFKKIMWYLNTKINLPYNIFKNTPLHNIPVGLSSKTACYLYRIEIDSEEKIIDYLNSDNIPNDLKQELTLFIDNVKLYKEGLYDYKAEARTRDNISEDSHISKIPFNDHTYNILKFNGIFVVRDLLNYTLNELKHLHGINQKSIDDIIYWVVEIYGLKFKESIIEGDILSKSLYDCDLSLRTYKGLRKLGIYNVEGLTKRRLSEIPGPRCVGLGEKSIQEIINLMDKLGLNFTPEKTFPNMIELKNMDMEAKLNLRVDDLCSVLDSYSINRLKIQRIYTIAECKKIFDYNPNILLNIYFIDQKTANNICNVLNEILGTEYKINI